jgi:hypothetical protein
MLCCGQLYANINQPSKHNRMTIMMHHTAALANSRQTQSAGHWVASPIKDITGYGGRLLQVDTFLLGGTLHNPEHIAHTVQ